jgi:signal transduction histidine kinase
VSDEVSCRALGIWFQLAERDGIPLEKVFEGVGYPLSHLQDKRGRIDWDAFARLLTNAGQIWPGEQLVEAGRLVIRNPYIKYFAVVGKVLMTAQQFYEYVFRKGSGAGNQFFSCIEPQLETVEPNLVRLVLRIPPQYAPSPEFFAVSQGNFSEMSTIVGLPAADVTMETDGRDATYLVRLPKGGGLVARVVRGLLSPFRAREAATELRDAHEELQLRVQQLESANKVIELKKHELELISTVTAAAHASLSLQDALKAICEEVCRGLGFQYAKLSVSVTQDNVKSVHSAASGRRPEESNSITVPLVFREVHLGHLTANRTTAITDDDRRFFAEVASACALAIHNAISFEVIGAYRTNLEQKVTERTAQLESALALGREQQTARQRIFQNISHELRTPLSLIALSTGDIEARDGGAISGKTKERLKQIDDAVTRLLHLFDGMLLLAAGQEGKLRIRPTDCDLAIGLRSLVSAWILSGEKHGIRLQYVGPDRLSCRVDEQGIERAVTNLLSNAMKFTPAGGTVEVRLAEGPNNTVEISVSDTGVGMDDEFLRRVFGRFEQGPAPVRPGERGSGIGLAIVKDIAVAHGGDATVKSQRGQGSTFTLSLPREADAAKLAAQGEGSYIPEMQAPVIDAASSGDAKTDLQKVYSDKEYTVLIAEDEPQLRAFLVELLSREFNVIAAPDGLAALALAEQHHPHLLLSDVGMPGLTGIELTRRFREVSGFRLAPVILLTAYALTESRLDGLSAGAVDYITKPFHPGELLARIRGQLELRQLAVRLHEAQKLAGLGVLAAGLAHELRNPATGVVSAIEPLKKMLPAEAKTQAVSQLLEAITQGSKQLEVLTRQLIGFNKQGPLEVRPEALASIFDTAESLARPALGSRLLKRELGYIGNVRCSRGLIIQVLVNLFENAAQASLPESAIVLRTREVNGLLQLDVADQGSGIKAGHRDRLFDPFFTTKEPGKGTGLGLTVSRLIAERHGGTLKLIDSERGATFRLELPLTDVKLPTDSPRLMSMAGAPV